MWEKNNVTPRYCSLPPRAEIFLPCGLVLAEFQSKSCQPQKKGGVEMQGLKAVVSGTVCAR